MNSSEETLLSLCTRCWILKGCTNYMCLYSSQSLTIWHFDELDELLSNFDCYHVVGGDFDAHTGILPDITQEYEDIRSDLPSDVGVSDVLSTGGCSVTRANRDCTTGRGCKK